MRAPHRTRPRLRHHLLTRSPASPRTVGRPRPRHLTRNFASPHGRFSVTGRHGKSSRSRKSRLACGWAIFGVYQSLIPTRYVRVSCSSHVLSSWETLFLGRRTQVPELLFFREKISQIPRCIFVFQLSAVLLPSRFPWLLPLLSLHLLLPLLFSLFSGSLFRVLLLPSLPQAPSLPSLRVPLLPLQSSPGPGRPRASGSSSTIL